MAMRFCSFVLLLLAGFTLPATMADARPRDREQDAAFRARQEGRIMPLGRIEGKIVPQMRGADYLGPELDAAMSRYRLKFLKSGRVIWVDVDARTGAVIGRSGD